MQLSLIRSQEKRESSIYSHRDTRIEKFDDDLRGRFFFTGQFKYYYVAGYWIVAQRRRERERERERARKAGRFNTRN